jgi:TPR repeat protein
VAERAEIVAEQRRLCRAQRAQLSACAELGDLFADPALGLANPDSARSYYELGCRGQGQASARQWLGVGPACRGLAALALATRSDTAAAARFYGIGCALFDMDACVEQGRLAQRAGASADETHPLYLFVSACVAPQPSGAGCEAAGKTFLEAQSDTAQAKRFYRTACELGNGLGCVALGTLERGPRGDSAAVLKYYRRGCGYGAGWACVKLGEVIAERFEDRERAERLVRRGCDLGSAAACWRAMQGAIAAGDEENAAVYRASACRLNRRDYCKRGVGTSEEPDS